MNFLRINLLIINDLPKNIVSLSFRHIKKTPDLIKFWGFLLPKIYPYEYHSFTAKYLIDRYY